MHHGNGLGGGCYLFHFNSRDNFSTTTRTEGWLEVWGDNKAVGGDDECWQDEMDAAARSVKKSRRPYNGRVLVHSFFCAHLVVCSLLKLDTCSFLHDSFIGASIIPGVPLTIVQYRPAWLEQLVLRIAGIPHVVLNSSYSSNESTGPLPCLHDSQGGSCPILVGRRQPGLRRSLAHELDDGGAPSAVQHQENSDLGSQQNNSILEYLKMARAVDLDVSLVDPTNSDLTKQRQAKSSLLKLLVTTQLQTSLMILRYEDADAWVQVYRKQCFDASKPICGVSNNSRYLLCLPTARGLYQAWSERVMARKGLMGLGLNATSVDNAKKEARNAYAILEQQLAQQGDGSFFLLDTSQPVLVDVMLWAHLAEALCDVNLVVILADFPRLINYFHFIHKKYFATSSESMSSRWQVWNKHQNSINCFHQIPLDADGGQAEKLKDLKNALELIQALSAHDRDLLKLLQEAKEVRAQELARNRGQELSRDPGGAETESDGEQKPKLTDAQEALLQQHRHDRIWLMSVALVACAYGLFLTNVGSGDD
jgi:hypothetical protein